MDAAVLSEAITEALLALMYVADEREALRSGGTPYEDYQEAKKVLRKRVAAVITAWQAVRDRGES